MSLLVNAYTRKADGQMVTLSVDHADELAGFERCRRELWGHNSVCDLGAMLLPELDGHDIYAEGVAITQLETDVNLILAHLSKIAAETDFPEDYIEHRCRNILSACKCAREIGGGVVIW